MNEISFGSCCKPAAHPDNFYYVKISLEFRLKINCPRIHVRITETY